MYQNELMGGPVVNKFWYILLENQATVNYTTQQN